MTPATGTASLHVALASFGRQPGRWIHLFDAKRAPASPVVRTHGPAGRARESIASRPYPTVSQADPWAWRMAFVAFTLALLMPLTAGAVELYSDPCCGGPVIYQPQVVTLPPPKVIHVATSPEIVVVHEVKTVQVDQPSLVEVNKDLLSWLEGRAGAGLWIFPGLKEDVHLGYNLDVALSMRGFLVGLDFTWIHGLKWDRQEDGESCVKSGNLALVGMKLGYRFNEDGRVHPELTARFDTLILDREKEGTVMAFGLGGSAGLYADFPLKFGAIVVGLEVAGHRHVWSQNGFYPPRASVAVMGSLGYKF